MALYRLLGRAASPLLRAHLQWRARHGKEDPQRLGERWGRPGRTRPAGGLVWLHGASVGEALSSLELIERIRRGWPGLNILITTGTVSSAEILARQLPPEVVHQYLPIDQLTAVARFLDHWDPQLGLILESELWPTLLGESKRRGIDMVLINGRMSPKSYRRWRRCGPLIREILGAFDLICAQSPENEARLIALGAGATSCPGNLKFSAAPLPVEAETLALWESRLGQRSRWLAASTHPGEEAMVAVAHVRLKRDYPDLVTIIVPRHPPRGPEIADALRGQGLAVARLGEAEGLGEMEGFGQAGPLADATEILIADSIGQMGLWYRLAEVVFIGGSLVPHGGQNPLEPARLNCAVIAGPHTENFRRMTKEMRQAGALLRIDGAEGLSAAVARLLGDAGFRAAMVKAAQNYSESHAGVLERVVEVLRPYLDRATAYPRG